LLTPKDTPRPEPKPKLKLEPKLDAGEDDTTRLVDMPRGWEPILANAEALDQRSNNALRREEISS
jgi:hypothetical protein